MEFFIAVLFGVLPKCFDSVSGITVLENFGGSGLHRSCEACIEFVATTKTCMMLCSIKLPVHKHIWPYHPLIESIPVAITGLIALHPGCLVIASGPLLEHLKDGDTIGRIYGG